MAYPSSLVKQSRQEAELSIRALADRASLAASTVSRIEAGTVSPTHETLDRLLHACGRKLELSASPAPIALANLATAWKLNKRGETRPDWTRLRAFIDWVEQHPDEKDACIVIAPEQSGSQIIDNLLAGIAETLSDETGQRPPGWVKRVRPLNQPWSMPAPAQKRESWLAMTPPRLADRGLIIDAPSLWRDRSLRDGS